MTGGPQHIISAPWQKSLRRNFVNLSKKKIFIVELNGSNLPTCKLNILCLLCYPFLIIISGILGWPWLLFMDLQTIHGVGVGYYFCTENILATRILLLYELTLFPMAYHILGLLCVGLRRPPQISRKESYLIPFCIWN